MELLRQNLAVESDLQIFSGHVLDSVARLQGNPFTTIPALLTLIGSLRSAGAASGFPLPVSLVYANQELRIAWGNEYRRVVSFPAPHMPEQLQGVHQHLQASTQAIDPDVLLQRNAEMVRHFEQVRARNEQELAEMQRALEKGRHDLERLAHQAETDALTGLYNRRAFDVRLEQMFRHAMRQRSAPLSLLMLDLDYFKQVNDEFGHQYGDAYLNKMAHVLRASIREDVDMAFRFGGDEFALVLFADHRQAHERAMHVLDLMSHKVSIGISSIDEGTPEGYTLEEFINQADHALYEAKHQGRGRAVVRNHEQGEGRAQERRAVHS